MSMSMSNVNDVLHALREEVVSKASIESAFQLIRSAETQVGSNESINVLARIMIELCSERISTADYNYGIEMWKSDYLPFLKLHHHKLDYEVCVCFMDKLTSFGYTALKDLLYVWDQCVDEVHPTKCIGLANFVCQRVSATIAYLGSRLSNPSDQVMIGKAIGVLASFKGILSKNNFKGEADQKVCIYYSKAILNPQTIVDGLYPARNDYFSSAIFPGIYKLFDYDVSPLFWIKGDKDNVIYELFAPYMLIGLSLLCSTQLQVDAVSESGSGTHYTNHIDIIITALSHLTSKFCGTFSDSLLTEIVNRTVWSLIQNKEYLINGTNITMHEKEYIQIDGYLLLECCCCETDQSISLIRTQVARSILSGYIKVCSLKDHYNIIRSIEILFGQIAQSDISVTSICHLIRELLLVSKNNFTLLLLEKIVDIINSSKNYALLGFATYDTSKNTDFVLNKRRYNSYSSRKALETLVLNLPISSLKIRGVRFNELVSDILNNGVKTILTFCDDKMQSGYSLGLSLCLIASQNNNNVCEINENTGVINLTTLDTRNAVKFIMNTLESYETLLQKLLNTEEKKGIFSFMRLKSSLEMIIILSRCLAHQNLPIKRFYSLVKIAKTLASICKNIGSIPRNNSSNDVHSMNNYVAETIIEAYRCSCFILEICSRKFPEEHFSIAVDTYNLLLDTAKLAIDFEWEHSWKLWVTVLTSLTSFAKTLPSALKPKVRSLVPQDFLYLLQARNKGKTASLEAKAEVLCSSSCDRSNHFWDLSCVNSFDQHLTKIDNRKKQENQGIDEFRREILQDYLKENLLVNDTENTKTQNSKRPRTS